MMASWERRLGAYLIDLIPVFGLGLALGFKSSTGAWIAAAYMLVRDVGGASPGKLVLGLRVVGRNGGSASVPQRVLRNVVLGLQGVAAVLIPLSGVGALGLFAQLGPSGLMLIDGLYLVEKGERLSDRIAGTRVVTHLGLADQETK